MIKGLFETHINVSSLERSMKFYGEMLELELGSMKRREESHSIGWVIGAKPCLVFGKNRNRRF